MAEINANFSSGLFRDHLDDLRNQVDLSKIYSEKKTPNEQEVEVASGLNFAIENFKQTHNDLLDHTVDKASKAVQDTFTQLKTMVSQFTERKNIENLLSEATKQLVDQFPFSYYQSRLNHAHPCLLIIDDKANHVSLVTFKGSFPWSTTKEFEPSFTLSDRLCHLAKCDSQSLTFQVPQDIFHDSSPQQFAYKTGTLHLPWAHGFLNYAKIESDYKVDLAALPENAGDGFVEYASGIEKRREVFKLNWKDSLLFKPKEGETIHAVYFTSFKNDQTTKYLKLSTEAEDILQMRQDENGDLTIRAQPPKGLRGFSEKVAIEEKITPTTVETPINEVKILSTTEVKVEVDTSTGYWPGFQTLTEILNQLKTLVTPQSAELLKEAEALQEKISQSSIQPEEAASKLQDLTVSVRLIQEAK